MQEFLGAAAILAGFVWAVSHVLAAFGRGGLAGEWSRAIAALLLIGAGSFVPVYTGSDTPGPDADEEP